MREVSTDGARNEVRYLLRELGVFYDLRVDYDVILDNYAERLRAVRLTADAAEIARDAAAGPAAERRPWAEFLARWRSFAHQSLRFFARIPHYWAQHRRMRGLDATTTDAPRLLIAVASNRLHGLRASAGPRAYFSLLTREFVRREDGLKVSDEIVNVPVLYVCEALPHSPLWDLRDRCHAERVFIIDGAYLLFLGIVQTLLGRARHVWRGLADLAFYREVRRGKVSTRAALRDVLASTLVIEGCWRAFAGKFDLSAYFLTSNSFVTEVLRHYLILESRCSSICEIMHGIPTVIYERYLADMLGTGATYNAAHKHSSVAQLPMLPMFGILVGDVKCGPKHAINSYLNRYWIERRKGDESLADVVAAECRKLFAKHGIKDDTVVITFVGGMSQFQDCFRSDTFKTECFMLRQAKQVMASSGQPFRIIYTPHPGYPLASFQQHAFFRDEDIVVYPDTIFTWFVSDMGLSLFSSALFEASYFGVHGFTPTIPEDDIYPAVLLDLLDRPKGPPGASYVEDLRRFVATHSTREPADLVARARQRAERYHPYDS